MVPSPAWPGDPGPDLVTLDLPFRGLSRELGPRGVTVHSVAPGLIDTDITAGKLVGEKEKQVLAGVPVGRKGRAADVADLITYLCREESGYITGATYDVNGGAHIH